MTRKNRRNCRGMAEGLEGRFLLSGAAGWSTVDDFQPLRGGNSANAIIADNNAASVNYGAVYAVGCAQSPAGEVGTVRERLPGAAETSWTTIEQYQLAAGYDVFFNSAAVDNQGNLFVAGQASDAAHVHWIVLEKAAASSTFQLIDNFQFTSGYNSWANSIAICGGNIYVAGVGMAPLSKRSNIDYWVVRELAANQTAFATVDQFIYNSTTGASANAVSAAPDASGAIHVYVAGNSYAGNHWLVRASAQAGASGTWSTVDNFQVGNLATALAVVAAPADGNVVYVAGRDQTILSSTRTSTSAIYDWIVRKSVDGGQTWSIDDDWRLSNELVEPNGIGMDQSGNVYTVGEVNSPTGYIAITRTNAAGSWQESDRFQLASGYNSMFFGFAQGADGTLYTCGDCMNANGDNWIVRDPPPPSASTATASFSSTPITCGADDSLTSLGTHRHHHRAVSF